MSSYSVWRIRRVIEQIGLDPATAVVRFSQSLVLLQTELDFTHCYCHYESSVIFISPRAVSLKKYFIYVIN